MESFGEQSGWRPPAGASPWSLRSGRYWALVGIIVAMCELPTLLGTFVPTGSGAASGLLVVGAWLLLVILAWPLGRRLRRRWRDASPSRADFLLPSAVVLVGAATKDQGLLLFLLSVVLPAVPVLLLALGLGIHHRDRV